jgi:acyl-CoA thioesterase FadM
LNVLHQTEVTPDQIDHLGHMNVRFYGLHARAGAEVLLDGLGVGHDQVAAGEGEGGGGVLLQTDTYVRHHREQLVGSPLEVRGGVLDASTRAIRLYEELANVATGERAASFVLRFELADRATRTHVPFPSAVVDAAAAATVEVPPHGQPRSISIDEDVVSIAPSFAEATRRDLAHRLERTITPTEGEDDGFVPATALPELIWGGEPVPGHEFRPLEPLPGGGEMGFATMETRATWVRTPRVGDRVQSCSAMVAIAAKTILARNWLFDVARGDAVGVFSVVNVAFDTGSRRAIEIPDPIRERFERQSHPDLAHTDLAHTDVAHTDVAHPDVAHPDVAHPDVAHPDQRGTP